MCGIAGILFFNTDTVQSVLLKKMARSMSHRGPDSEGIFHTNQIGLCHRRLSIIDLSTYANQPFFDNSNRYTIVFNGEIYNYQEIKNKIKGYTFKTSGDTETLIAAYSQWGTDCLQYLKGMFAFAIWDNENKELCLVRDRMGVKPLYYYVDDEKLIFASEIRAILSTGLVSKKLNPKAIYEYLSYQSVNFPESIIENIQQLEAGTWMKIKGKNKQIEKYWNLWDVDNSFQYDNITTVKKNS